MPSIQFRNKTIKYIQREGFWNSVESGAWEPWSFDILDRFIKPGEAFIDIGAWNGILSIYAAMLGAKSYAIEPDEVCLDELIQNVFVNDLAIDIDGIAISDKRSTDAELTNITEGWGNSQSSIINRGNSNTGKRVITETLQNYVNHRPQIKDICLVKIDTEGSEVLIIPESAEFLRSHKSVVYLSLHSYWFPDRESDIFNIAKPVFDIYDVFNARDLTSVSGELFYQKLMTDIEYEVLLIPKA